MGGLFKRPKTPDIKVNPPPLQNPIKQPEAPELGAQDTPQEKAKKGKKGLKIALDKSRVGSNII